MIKHKSYKYRIYPNDDQIKQIETNFTCSRLVYNKLLDRKNKAYKRRKESYSKYDTIKMLPAMKKYYKSLKEADSICLQCAVEHLDLAYKNFFKKNARFPCFKRKKDKNQSFTTKAFQGNIYIEKGFIKLPKLGFVKLNYHRKIEGRILNVTVSRNSIGKYYVSVCCEVDIKPLDTCENQIGIDLGLTHILTDNNGIQGHS